MTIVCLTPGCDKIRQSLGLCSSCYSRLHRQVRRGQTTWACLEAAGRCLPASGGRKREYHTRRFFAGRKS